LPRTLSAEEEGLVVAETVSPGEDVGGALGSAASEEGGVESEGEGGVAGDPGDSWWEPHRDGRDGLVGEAERDGGEAGEDGELEETVAAFAALDLDEGLLLLHRRDRIRREDSGEEAMEEEVQQERQDESYVANQSRAVEASTDLHESARLGLPLARKGFQS